MFDLVEGKVKRGEFCERVEALDVRDEVVVKVDFGQRCGGVGRYLDSLDTVLSQTETLQLSACAS